LHHAGIEVPAWDGPGSGLAAAVRVSHSMWKMKIEPNLWIHFLSPSRSSLAMRSPWI